MLKLSLRAEGHVLTKKDCEEISRLLISNYELARENMELKGENAVMKSELERIVKDRVYQLDPYRVLVVSNGEVTYIDGTSKENTVIINHIQPM